MLTIRSLLQTLPVFSNSLFMLKSTYFNTLCVMVLLQSMNIFGVKFRDSHIIDGTENGKHECTLGPERRYRFPKNRFVREILACAHKIWRKVYIPYFKKGESERNFHMGGFLERYVRYSSAFYTCGI